MIGLALSLGRRVMRIITPKAWAVLAALGLILILLAYCTSQARQDERAQAKKREVEAYAAQIAREAEADETASSERLEDFRATTDSEKERTDATASIPDSRPSDRRVARACVQLRQQGTARRDLPPACR